MLCGSPLHLHFLYTSEHLLDLRKKLKKVGGCERVQCRVSGSFSTVSVTGSDSNQTYCVCDCVNMRVFLPSPRGPLMWIRACSFQHVSLPCYVRITNNTLNQPEYAVRISSSDSASCASSNFSEPPPTMFHKAWQTWPASCQSPAPRSFRQSASLVTSTHTHTHRYKSYYWREKDSHDRQVCEY